MVEGNQQFDAQSDASLDQAPLSIYVLRYMCLQQVGIRFFWQNETMATRNSNNSMILGDIAGAAVPAI